MFDYGILAAAGLAVIGYYWKLNQYRKESAKTLLFYLLEIRQELLIERPKLDSVADEFQSELDSILGNRPKLKSIFAEHLSKQYIANVVHSMMDGMVRADQGLLDSYEMALVEYSRINPWTAHKVRGMKLLPKLSENLAGISSSILDGLPKPEGEVWLNALGDQELGSTERDTLGEFIEDLEKVICRVSRSAGLDHWVRSWFLPSQRRRDQKSANNNIGADLEAIIGRFFKLILLNLNLEDGVKNQINSASLETLLDLLESSLAKDEANQSKE